MIVDNEPGKREILRSAVGGADAHTFGSRLRRYRVAAGLSQEALAERAGLSRRGIADLERGARNFPYGDTVQRLATALDLSVAERADLLVAGQRPDAASPTAGHKLPIEVSGLVGRERELAELQHLLDRARLLTLTGSAGIGKTRLALALADQHRSRHLDGAALVELAPVADPELVAEAVANAIGVRRKPDTRLTQSIQEHVGAQDLLIVVDNCEHLLEPTAKLVDALLRGCPRLQILATSREPMRIPGETVWPVPALNPEEAVELFIARASEARATLTFSENDVKLIGGICARLEGIPLAIELAAARVPAFGLSQIAARLSERLRLLSSGSRLDPLRHRTLRAAIDWSYALLSPGERDLFQCLSVFAGGWELDAVGPVCAFPSAESEEDVRDLLAGLVDKSLVVSDIRGGQVRYRLLETMREFAADHLQASGRAEQVRRGHAAYYRSLIAQGSFTRRGVRYARDVDLVHREHDNFRAALAALLALGDLEGGLALCQLLSGWWLSRGGMTEGEEWFGRFLANADRVEWEVVAQALYSWGRIAEYRGALDVARSLHERSLRVAREHDDGSHAALALFGLGDVAQHQGEFERAAEHFLEGLALGRAAGLQSDLAEALGSLGRIEDIRGNRAQARLYREESVNIHRRLGDRWGVAYGLNELSQQARNDGQLDQAQSMLEESHILFRQAGSRMGERAALMNLAVIVLERGALVRSVALALQSLQLCHDIEDASATTARCVEIAAQVLHARGSPETVVRLLASATALRNALGAPVPPDEQPELERTLSAARSALSAEAFLEASTDGGRLHIQEAVELASDTLSSP